MDGRKSRQTRESCPGITPEVMASGAEAHRRGNPDTKSADA